MIFDALKEFYARLKSPYSSSTPGIIIIVVLVILKQDEPIGFEKKDRDV